MAREMKALGLVVCYIIWSLVAGALLGPLFWGGLQAVVAAGWFPALAETPFPRVLNRGFMAAAAIGLLPLLRALQVRGAAAWGFAVGWRQGWRWALLGVGLGLASVGTLIALELALGAVTWNTRRTAWEIADALLGGLLVGAVVSVIEEVFCRGLLYRAVQRDYGAAMAVSFTTVLYATAHFLTGRNYDGGEITWASGLHVLGTRLHRLIEPDQMGALIALLVTGLVLALCRYRQGHLWLCLGLHAGWVAMIAAGRKATNWAPEATTAWLVSPYDDIIGYLAAAWLLALALLLGWYGWRRLPPPAAADP
jgi:membrane protease YdiL (CAAX protease family)